MRHFNKSLFVLFLSYMTIISSANSEEVGVLNGKAGVSASGAATYSIPIEVPPALSGLQPSISLEYNSQARHVPSPMKLSDIHPGAGSMGLGWNIAGLSSISRCQTDWTRDGGIDAVDYDSNDQFCLDGQRLILISGNHGATGAEYRTEINANSKILVASNEGYGPTSFKIVSSNGQVTEYGFSSNSRQEARNRNEIDRWNVSAIKNSAGNQIDFFYEKNTANLIYRILKVDYSHHSIQFAYAPSGVNNAKLSEIELYTNSSKINGYSLKYESKESYLTSVAKCSKTNECLTETTFNWLPASTGIQDKVVSMRPFSGFGGEYSKHVGDFNGDGISDISLVHWSENYGLIIYTSLLNKDGGLTETKISRPLGGFGGDYSQHVADFNGDSISDISLVHWSKDYGLITYTSLGKPDGTFKPAVSSRPMSGFGGDYSKHIGDFNGDGISDISLVHWSQNYGLIIYTSLFNKEGKIAETKSSRPLGGFGGDYSQYVADFNGDGISDLSLVHWSEVYGFITYISLGKSDGSFASAIRSNPLSGFGGEYFPQLGDFNGDGKTDISLVHWSDVYGLIIYTSLSNGDGTLSNAVYSRPLEGFGGEYTQHVADFNGDGLADVSNIHWSEDYGLISYTAMAVGDGTFHNAIYSRLFNGFGGEYSKHIGNFNADQHADISLIHWSETYGLIIYNALTQNSTSRISDIVNGLSISSIFSYTTASDTSVYSNNDESDYPMVNYMGSMPLVDSLVYQSGGASLISSTSYFYEGMKTHRLGLGSLGFAKVTTTNDQTGIISVVEYEQDYVNRLIGNVKSTKTITPADATSGNPSVEISASTTLWESEGTPGSTYKLKLRKTTTQNKSLSGDNTYSSETSYCLTDAVGCTLLPTSYDGYGNPLIINSTVNDQQNGGETFTTQTTNEYWGLNHFATASDFYTSQIHRVTVVKDGSNRDRKTRVAEFNDYYANGKLKKETIEQGGDALVTEYEYEEDGFYGRITQKTASGANITKRSSSIAYNAINPYFSTSTNALNQTTTTEHSPKWGTVLNKTNINGLTVTHSYDDFGRKASTSLPDGTTVTYTLDWCVSNCPENAVYYSTATTTDSLSINHSKTYFDALQRKVAASTLGFDGSDIQVDYLYDALGRQYKTSLPYFAGSETPIYKVNSVYDILNRVKEVTHPNSTTSIISYDGLITTYTNAKNQQKVMVKNALGETITSTDDDYKVLSLEYDALGNLVTTTDEAGNPVIMNYDVRGNKTSMTDLDKGHWKYEYNELGQLVLQTDAKNQSTCMVYDVLGRMTKRIDDYLASITDYESVKANALNNCAGDVSNSQAANWTFDTSPVKGKGKLHTLSDGNDYFKTMTYDLLGRVSNKAITINGKTHNVVKTYYANSSKVDTMVYPQYSGSSFTVRNSYKPTGFLYKTHNYYNSSEVYWQATDMNARGQLTNFTLGNSVTTTNTYNPETGFIEVIDSLKGGVAGIQYLDYKYNEIGNLEHRKDFIKGLSEQFGYDDLNRLTGSTITGTDASGSAFREDEVTDYKNSGLGNIHSKTGVGIYTYGTLTDPALKAEGNCVNETAGPHAVTYVSGGSANSASVYCYDQNGDMTSGAGRTIEYTAFGKASLMTKGTSNVEFIYGPNRTRIQRIDNGLTTTTYVEGIYEEQETSGVLTGKYYIGNYAVVTKEASTSETNYLHRDHLGSVDAITDSNGVSVAGQQMSFDAWGKRREATWDSMSTLDLFNFNTQITKRGYTNHEQVDSMGLIHMNGRVYDPILSRFISADPIIQEPLDMQSYNRYSYVKNNPLAYTDPSGYLSIKKFGRWLDKEFIQDGGPIYKMYRDIGREIKRGIARNPETAQIAGSVACSIYAGAGASGCIALVSSYVTYAVTGDLKASLRAGALAYITAAVSAEANNYINANLSNPGLTILAKGGASGAISWASGGSFEQGFYWGAGTQALAEIYKGTMQNYLDGDHADLVDEAVYPDEIPFATEDASFKHAAISDQKTAQFGLAGDKTALLSEHNLQGIPKNVPFAHAISIHHDLWNGALIDSGFNFGMTNVPTMLVSGLLATGGAMRNHWYMNSIYEQQDY